MSLAVSRRPVVHRGALASPGERRGGHPVLHRRDVEVLRFLGEQYCARVDQLEMLTGCGPRTVQRILARLSSAGFITTAALIGGEPRWAIPTSSGMAAGGTGFGIWRPRIGLMAHVAAVNDVRLHVQSRAPSTEWVIERTSWSLRS